MGGFTLEWFDYAFAGLVFCVVTAVGLLKTRHATEDDFLVGGRNTSWPLLALSIAAGVLGGGVMLVFSQFAFSYGFSSLCIIGGIVLGTFLLVPIALKYKPVADNQGFYSLPDLFRFYWGRYAGWLSTAVVAVWTLGFIAMQLIAAGFLLNFMTGLQHWIGVLAVAGIVASYLIVGGFRSVILTDALQYAALGIVLLIVLPSSSSHVDLQGAVERSGSIDLAEAIGFFVLGGLNMVVSADLWQRVYAAKSPKAARNGVIAGAFLVLAGGVLLMIPALAASGLPDLPEDSRSALVIALETYCPRPIAGLAMAAILMSVMSTLDTMVFVLGLSLSHDLMVETLGKPIRYRRTAARVSMVLALAFGASIAGASNSPDAILNVGIAVTSFALILAPPLLFSRRSKPVGQHTVCWSLTAGAIAAAALVIGECVFDNVLTPENSMAVLGASLLGALAGGIYTRCLRQRAK